MWSLSAWPCSAGRRIALYRASSAQSYNRLLSSRLASAGADFAGAIDLIIDFPHAMDGDPWSLRPLLSCGTTIRIVVPASFAHSRPKEQIARSYRLARLPEWRDVDRCKQPSFRRLGSALAKKADAKLRISVAFLSSRFSFSRALLTRQLSTAYKYCKTVYFIMVLHNWYAILYCQAISHTRSLLDKPPCLLALRSACCTQRLSVATGQPILGAIATIAGYVGLLSCTC